MKKRVLLNIMIASMAITGCGAFQTIAKEPTPVIEETKDSLKPRAVTSENIIITDEAAAENSEEIIAESSGISLDAGDSKILESTIDQITEKLEK